MLNQCLIIGRIKELHSNEEGLVERIVLEVRTSSDTDRISINTPQEKAQYGHFIENCLVAVKARISSKNGNDYVIKAERISVLGGSSNGS